MSDHEPPSLPGDDRAMSPAGVVGWTLLVVLLFIQTIQLSGMVREGLANDLVNNQICFSFAFTVATAVMVRRYLPMHDVTDAVGARAVPWWLLGLGLLTGALLQLPALWIGGLIETRWPLGAEETKRITEMMTFQSTRHRVAFALATALIGPLSEELFCRGVMFRALRRTWSPVLTVAMTTASFAFLHLDWRYAINAAYCGVILGLVRLWTGSVWVSLAGHVAFNTVTTVALLAGWVKAEDTAPVSAAVGVGGAVALGLVMAVMARATREQPLVRAAVEADQA